MAKKKKHEDEEVNEFAAEAEKTGDISHEEAVQASKPADDADVKKPELKGHTKEEYGQPKFEQPGTNNQKREVIGEDKSE